MVSLNKKENSFSSISFQFFDTIEKTFSSSPIQLVNMASTSTTTTTISTKSNCKRSLNFISLAFIAYFAIAAGPFGIEDAVQAAGPFPTLIAVFTLPLLWGLPQALMTIELSSMIDANGGYILWVQRGLGDFWGWMNAFNSIASNLTDLPTYPVLFAGYVRAYLIQQKIPVTDIGFWLLKLVSLFFVLIANIIGIRSVAIVSIFLTIFVLAPFVLEPFLAKELHTEVWGESAKEIAWPLFLSTIIWNYQGWDSLGCIAGEVKNAGRSYPLGIALALILIMLNYALPVAVGTAVETDYSKWNEGTLETIAIKISNTIGIWVGLGAIISTLGEFNVIMACTSRALWATAKAEMLPNILSLESKTFGTPVAAILFQGIIVLFLMSFSFSQLILVDTFFNNVSLLLEFASFLRLKYIESDTYRPFEVPGGLFGAWFITIPKFLVISCILLWSSSFTWIFCGTYNVLLIFIYLIWKKKRERRGYTAIEEL